MIKCTPPEIICILYGTRALSALSGHPHACLNAGQRSGWAKNGATAPTGWAKLGQNGLVRGAMGPFAHPKKSRIIFGKRQF